MVLKRSFYERPTLEVARKLLGKILKHKSPQGITSGKIVEAEAYIGPDDPACHASKGRTPRNEVMFGQPGHAYVYFNYGMYYLLNVVTEREGFPAAVLIRAIEPTEGIELMSTRRRCFELTQLANGPGKLCVAMGIDKSLNGADLCGSALIIEDGQEYSDASILWAPRIGIKHGRDKLWRCYVADGKFTTSGGRPARRS